MARHADAPSALDRRAFLTGVLKLGAGATALSLLGCEVAEGMGEGGPGKCGGELPPDEVTDAVARPEQLFSPVGPSMMLDEKWRLQNIVRKPDTHLCVTLRDVQTGNPLDIEVFRGLDPQGRAIAQTDRWEFYVYDAETAGTRTPDHVVDAISLLALNLTGHENRPPFVRLSETVCMFADRDTGPAKGAENAG